MRLTDLTDAQYAYYAEKALANWKNFDSFSYNNSEEDPENLFIFNTSNRDSTILDKANEAVMLEHFNSMFEETKNKNWWLESHRHALVGYVDCFVFNVYDENKQLTKEFKEICKIIDYMSNDHHILDDSTYSEFEYQALLDNIKFEGYKLQREHNLSDGWEKAVASYWYDNDRGNKLENTDDTGAWLSREDIELALASLGIINCDHVET